MDVTLRPATEDDEPFLYEIYKSAHSAELPADCMDANQRELILRMQFLAQQQSYAAQFPEAEDRIILADGREAGRWLVERMDSEIRAIDLALLPGYRNKGIGSLLLQDLMAEAAAAGKPLRLHVVKTNRAVRLYERLGIYKTGESGMHFSMEWSSNK
jgi:ribosomal protein S18 acetylase RimI-like enzyme